MATAIELLDAAGEHGLTFRALATKLATGPGTLYWHVANKSELLAAATDAVLMDILNGERSDESPEDTVRSAALSIFNAIDAHPWVGPQLSRNSWQSPTMLHVFELIGQQLQRAGVPSDAQFACVTALVTFILGAGNQNALNARVHTGSSTRTEMLDAVAHEWEELDQADYPFMHDMVQTMRDHDDEEQFLAGIDMILAGAGITKATAAKRGKRVKNQK